MVTRLAIKTYDLWDKDMPYWRLISADLRQKRLELVAYSDLQVDLDDSGVTDLRGGNNRSVR